MDSSKLSLRFLITLASLLVVTLAAWAQYRASIQGVVTDPQGAVVSGATLTLRNLQTNLTLTATTNENGIYNFSALPPSQYSLTVEKTGFKKKVFENLGVIPEQSNAVNIQLEIGQVTESITVSGDSTPLIDTETASLNGVVSSNEIQHMPSFGRDVIKLAQLAPGAFGDGSQGGGGGDNYNLPGTQSGGGLPAATTASSKRKTARRSSPTGSKPRTTAFPLTASAQPAPCGAAPRSSLQPKTP